MDERSRTARTRIQRGDGVFSVYFYKDICSELCSKNILERVGKTGRKTEYLLIRQTRNKPEKFRGNPEVNPQGWHKLMAKRAKEKQHQSHGPTL